MISHNTSSKDPSLWKLGRDYGGICTALFSRNCFKFSVMKLLFKIQYRTDTGTFSQTNGTRRV